MRPLLLLLLALLPVPALAQTAPTPPVDLIDPFIGTGAQGKTFPGAATPGGMVQLSPDTITGGDNGSGYRYRDSTLQGFSFTHLSGVGWYGDLGNLLVTPTSGPLNTYPGETDHPGSGYLAPFSHATESASAGYYAVTLSDSNIRTELTASPHAGILRFTFPQNPSSRIQLDLAHRIGGTSLLQSAELLGDHTLEGAITCTPDGGGWGHGAGKPNYTLFFHAEFSIPLTDFGFWSADLPPNLNYRDALHNETYIAACRSAKLLPATRKLSGAHLGFYANVPTTPNQQILLKVGLSFTSLEGARKNLLAEIPAFDFDAVHTAARNAWAAQLNHLQIDGGSPNERIAFYTALYHALLDPRTLTDVDGAYPGGDGAPHLAKSFTKRTVFSGWDVYRSAFPLYTLIAPQTVSDTLNSFITLADENQTHTFDRWEFFNAYSGCMNGNPALIVLNDAVQKDIRSFDLDKAYQFAVNTTEKLGNGDRAYSTDKNHALSSTFENAFADWNLAALAKALNHPEDAAKYLDRATRAYRESFDPAVPWTYDEPGKSANPAPPNPLWQGWFRGRSPDGAFLPWRGLLSENACQEASVYQQGWLVPYDVPGLIDLLGGPELFRAKLTDFFDRTPYFARWNPYYNQPNEPVHLIPFLFNRAGAPWLTQKYVRKALDTYTAGPNGLCGDEDVGQMSAWYILASIGLHPACPGEPTWEISTPLFNRITLNLPAHDATPAATFTITTENQSPQNLYIQSATLNTHPLTRSHLTHPELTTGGHLHLTLGPTPNPTWGH